MTTVSPALGRSSLQTWRETLTVALVALLPLHALLVTVLTKFIAGPGHPPLPWLALWKETLLVAILVIAAIELLRSWKRDRSLPKADLLDAAIVALFALAMLTSALAATPLAKMLLGLRYDLFAPLSFILLRRVPWSASAEGRLLKVLLLVAIVVAAFALIGLILPLPIFDWLGYSTNFHSLYLPDSPLQPFSQIGETTIRRAQSTMSGPNQLGIWLSIPLAVLLAKASHRRSLPVRAVAVGVVLLAALIATFSRSAWIAVAACFLVTGAIHFDPKAVRRWLAPSLGLVAMLAVVAVLLAPKAFVRLSSTRGHFLQPLAAIQKMIDKPLGEGLASAGPASSRFADACVILRPQDDPSWAKAQPELCVFLGPTQVQPSNRICHCPFHPENWYLQLGVELGWAGFLLWVGVTSLVLWNLLPLLKSREPLGATAAFAQLSLAISSLFLHAWEDTAVALTIWILTAIALRSQEAEE